MCLTGSYALAVDDNIKAAVRDLSIQGKDDFDAGRFESAALAFQKAFATVKVPTLGLWAARSEAKLGHLVAASELYRQALQLSPNELWVGDAQQLAQSEAQQDLDALLPRLAKLQIDVIGGQPSEVTITVDGKAMPSALSGIDRPTDPGQRNVVGKRGSEIAEATVELKEGEKRVVTLKFSGAALNPPVAQSAPSAPTAAAPSSEFSTPVSSSQPVASGQWRRTLGWIGLGVGAAGVIEGAITGIFVVQRYAKLKEGCPNDACDRASVDGYRVEMYNALRTASVVGFVVGGVGLAAGTTLLLTSPNQSTRLGVTLGPGSAFVHGAF